MAGAYDWTRLSTLTQRPDPPNLVLAGPAGIGKSCALRLCLGNSVAFWFQCSQDPTLRDSRDRIKSVARRRVEDGCVRWIVLEHADLLHTDAQAFLRRVIETSVGATRFVLEVRDAAAIAEPLLSRTILFNAPQLLPHEIRAEIKHRAPDVSSDAAERIANQCGGNIRWAILQGLGGGGDGMIAPTVPASDSVRTWSDLLRSMEEVQRTGTNPRAWLATVPAPTWDRAGGACPWAITAWLLSAQIPVAHVRDAAPYDTTIHADV